MRPELDAFGRRHNLARQLAATRVVAAAQALAVGRFRAVSFRSGRLTIEVSTTAARYLIQGELPALIDATNQKLGAEVVTSVSVRLGNPNRLV